MPNKVWSEGEIRPLDLVYSPSAACGKLGHGWRGGRGGRVGKGAAKGGQRVRVRREVRRSLDEPSVAVDAIEHLADELSLIAVLVALHHSTLFSCWIACGGGG